MRPPVVVQDHRVDAAAAEGPAPVLGCGDQGAQRQVDTLLMLNEPASEARMTAPGSVEDRAPDPPADTGLSMGRGWVAGSARTPPLGRVPARPGATMRA
jgi:hypothetical protein